jgi:hypothetical protein
VQILKQWYEELAGVPQFYTGAEGQKNNETATADRLKAEGADTQFRFYCKHISNKSLKPLVEQLYAINFNRLIYETAQYQTVEASPEGSLLRYLDEIEPGFMNTPPLMVVPIPVADGQTFDVPVLFPPPDGVDVDIVAFESVLDKLDRLNNFERFVTTVGGIAQQIPNVGDNLFIDEGVRNYAKDLKLDNILRPADEVDQIRQERAQAEAIQAQQMAEQQANAQAQQQQQQAGDKQADRAHQAQMAVLNAAMKGPPNAT